MEKSKSKSRKRQVKVQTLPATGKKLTKTEAKKVRGGLAVDPRDSSGNTVYIAGASGGVWKTTNK